MHTIFGGKRKSQTVVSTSESDTRSAPATFSLKARGSRVILMSDWDLEFCRQGQILQSKVDDFFDVASGQVLR
jgi:hypothetical protein